MKSDLATSIGVGIVGVLVGYFVCNMFVGEIQPVSVKTIDASVSATVASPSNEIFNYKALNPTVEVYVGECTEYSETGECLDGDIIEDNYDDQDFNVDLNKQNTEDEEESITDNQDVTERTKPLVNEPETE